MKFLDNVKKTLTGACVINTVLLITVYALGMMINENFIPTLDRVIGILLFSIALSCANRFLFSGVLNFPIRFLLHFLFTAASFYVMFILWGNYNQNGGAVLVILVLFTLVYGIVAGIVAAVRAVFREKANSKKEYKKVIKKDDDYKSVFSGKS